MEKMSKNNKHRFLTILMLAVITICMLLPAGCQIRDKSGDPAEVDEEHAPAA